MRVIGLGNYTKMLYNIIAQKFLQEQAQSSWDFDILSFW